VAVVAALVTLLALVLLVVFLLPMAAEQRQQHRADEYVEPAPSFEPGKPAFVVQIPAIGLNQVVVSGSEPAELRGGPGWRNGTASPGQGNTVVLGHSTLWGAPFGRLADVPAGSVISVRTTDGRVYRYRVDKVRTVRNADDAPMRQSGPKRLTLVTSAGGPFDTDRVVVVAGIAGSPPAVPKEYKAEVQRGEPGPYDDRPPGDALLLVSGFLVVAMGIWGALAFRGRRSFLAIALVAGPTIALGTVLVLFHLDAFLPSTF
jgi:LPXTG-site transpeptidase (sortase) family protein